jgi:hypothetical protein
MKPPPDFLPFSVDATWYETYWYSNPPARPSRFSRLLLWASAIFHRARQQARVPAVVQTRRQEAQI